MSKVINLYEELIQKLTTTTELTNIINTRVYTHTPQNTEFPNVRLNLKENNISNFSEQDYSYDLQIQIFSEKQTPKESLEIQEIIINILNQKDGDFINIDFIQLTNSSSSMQDKNNSIWQVNLLFKIY